MVEWESCCIQEEGIVHGEVNMILLVDEITSVADLAELNSLVSVLKTPMKDFFF